jgi:hypothetical protein
MLIEQVVDGPVPDSVHEPPGVNVTMPVGDEGVDEVSATAAVHWIGWLTNTGDGIHETVVTVECVCRAVTCTWKVLLLLAWLVSLL